MERVKKRPYIPHVHVLYVGLLLTNFRTVTVCEPFECLRQKSSEIDCLRRTFSPTLISYHESFYG